ncbi:MAG: CRTAC1 family protein [Planctomycetales bacterium]
MSAPMKIGPAGSWRITALASGGCSALGWLLLAIVLAGCRDKGSSPDGKATTVDDPVQTESGPLDSAIRKPPREPPVPVELGGIQLADVARERGLHYAWPEQPRPIPILETFGSGCAAFDADDDGWLDLLLVGDPQPALFRNLGQGEFAEVTAASGLAADEGNWTGCAIGDYDGDGLLDLIITGYHRLALYRNAGKFRFELATQPTGLDQTNHGRWGSSAGFMDLDGDGWLDLVLLNYVVYGPQAQKYCEFKPGVISGCTPREYVAEKGEIWRNVEGKRFELVPGDQGMDQTNGSALVLAFTDLDGDGRIDFYIGHDGLAADVLHNLGKMRFENIGLVSGLAVSENTSTMSAMGADWGDYNRDGLTDLTVTNFQKLSFALFRNLGNNCFVDAAKQTGLSRGTRNRLGFGAKWLDVDNDGWIDVCYANGHVYDNAPEVEGPDSQFRQPLSLFRNLEGKKFVDLVPGLGTDVQRPLVGRGLATGDFNNDGLMDLCVVDYEGPVLLLENQTRTSNHWLTMDLRGASPNLFAYGARLTGRGGGQVWVADVAPASSYLSSSDPRPHWGLGAVERLDTLTIRWPSGGTQTLQDVACDQILRIVEGAEVAAIGDESH